MRVRNEKLCTSLDLCVSSSNASSQRRNSPAAAPVEEEAAHVRAARRGGPVQRGFRLPVRALHFRLRVQEHLELIAPACSMHVVSSIELRFLSG